MANEMSSWLASFQTKFPDARADAASLDAFAIQGVRPACVYAPPDAARAAAAIRFAAENKIPVVPFGGGTQQGIGNSPPAAALVIHTQHLNRLIHHEPGDMVATAQAGMAFGAFQRALGERGQWLPLDGQENSTLGGMVATNCYGPLAEQHGTLRDMVLGMTVVNGDGVIRKCGGKVVKNVTGYALDKLYIGSLGTLGVITEVTFKLLPGATRPAFGTGAFDAPTRLKSETGGTRVSGNR
jgi:glycolate oxidase FAD binding subunit